MKPGTRSEILDEEIDTWGLFYTRAACSYAGLLMERVEKYLAENKLIMRGDDPGKLIRQMYHMLSSLDLLADEALKHELGPHYNAE